MFTPKPIHLRQSGHSFIELAIVTALAAILLSQAMPSFASLYANTQVSTQSNAILQSLHLARSHAVAKQRNVHICHLDRATMNTCDQDRGFNSTWSVGWLVFADNNSNKNLDDKDQVLQIIEMSNSVNIVFNQRGRLRFFANGSSRSAGFYICDRKQRSFRHIYLLHTGRARINQQLSERQKSICNNANT
ncbi:MAG: type IV fimbrial biogenesis protein FimT [Arenicella sp.]|jgi:type IV fimbrial biogenesis protein FimT